MGKRKPKRSSTPILPFTDVFQGTLLHRIKRHVPNYLVSASWALRGQGKDVTATVGVTPVASLELKLPTPEENYDLENAMQLHRAFPMLNRTQACDQGFWARLCHVEYWEYMRTRWDASKKQRNQRERYIAERYFVFSVFHLTQERKCDDVRRQRRVKLFHEPLNLRCPD